jgi:ParB-like chromosome segregation protein Spo0J
MVPVKNLIPYAKNSRTHDKKQVQQIAESIGEFGFTNPVLVDEEGGIIAGHGRVLAAKVLGMVNVPTITLAGLTEAQKRAYVIADNKLAMNAGWDEEMLRFELQALQALDQQAALGFDLELIGFDLQEIASILDDQADIDETKGVDYKEVFNIIVECSNEEEQEKIFNRLDTEGYKCRVQSL